VCTRSGYGYSASRRVGEHAQRPSGRAAYEMTLALIEVVETPTRSSLDRWESRRTVRT